ncbi:SCP2 sterol-binding domain-containing protein [Parasitella parasitica]|nr:SCP2 sterol-binding domain-containing protein [Parasitella parasitica]
MSSTAPSVNQADFKSDAVFKYLETALQSLKKSDKSKLLDQISGVFAFVIKNGQTKTEKMYALDLKRDGLVLRGDFLLNESLSPDVVLYVCDGDFVDLVKGRLSGQRAFMLGKLKIKGRMDLATRLDGIFRRLVGKGKL